MKDKHDKVTPDFPDMEGDYIYTKAEHAIDKADLERSDGDFFSRLQDMDIAAEKQGMEEHFLHTTIRGFEELMDKHGLFYLLEHMSVRGRLQFWAEIDPDNGY